MKQKNAHIIYNVGKHTVPYQLFPYEKCSHYYNVGEHTAHYQIFPYEKFLIGTHQQCNEVHLKILEQIFCTVKMEFHFLHLIGEKSAHIICSAGKHTVAYQLFPYEFFLFRTHK